MGGILRCPQVGCSIVSQWRKAFRRNSSSHSGSPFFREMRRTTSSERPFSMMSVCTSVVKPYSYFFSATSRTKLFFSSMLSVFAPAKLRLSEHNTKEKLSFFFLL